MGEVASLGKVVSFEGYRSSDLTATFAGLQGSPARPRETEREVARGAESIPITLRMSMCALTRHLPRVDHTFTVRSIAERARKQTRRTRAQ